MDEHQSVDSGPMWAHRITQFLFACAVIVSFVIFWYAGGLLRIPAEPRHGGSLLRQPTIGGTISALVVGLVLLLACTMLSSSFLRNRWFLAPLSAATAGLSAWSMRGGPMQEVLLYASSAAVFVQLAVELILLGALVASVWLFVWREPEPEDELATQGRIASSVAVQALVMGLVVLLLTQTDAKKQCVAAVFTAGLIGATTAQSFFPGSRSARWYWIGPVAVGVIGYLLAAMFSQGWSSGSRELDGFWAPLARPLPLDYASAGMFGVLIGYWMSVPESQDMSTDGPKAESGEVVRT
jgi:hypothetical protein